jgi:hypothetical protein
MVEEIQGQGGGRIGGDPDLRQAIIRNAGVVGVGAQADEAIGPRRQQGEGTKAQPGPLLPPDRLHGLQQR